jgi:hypothetical protein
MLALVLGGLVLGPGAGAQTQPFDDTALVDEYREDIPTAAGPKAAGGGGGQAATLPPDLTNRLHEAVGAEEAEQLEEVATSPRFGAPPTPLHEPDEGTLRGDDDASGALSAAVTAVSDGGGSLLPLLLALVFATGALAGAAVYRRRRPIV